MPRFRVTCTDGSTLWVDADDAAGVRRHLGHPGTVWLMKGLKEPTQIVAETDPMQPRPAPDAPPAPVVVVGEAVAPAGPEG